MESLKNLAFNLRLPPKVRENLRIITFMRRVWPEVLGDKADVAFPLSFDEGVLYVGVTDHYELQNLSSQHERILQKLRALYPAEEKFPLRVIKFLYRPVPFSKVSPEIPKRQGVLYPEDQWREVEALCHNILDSELGKLLLRVVRSYRKNIISD